MTRKLKGMLWGVALVSNQNTGEWLLLEQSIHDNPMNTIETAEALWGRKWSELQRLGACMIRLNMDGDVPCDLMFAWGQGNNIKADGIMEYSEEFEKMNTGLVSDSNENVSMEGGDLR
jgi:hypothetical protein